MPLFFIISGYLFYFSKWKSHFTDFFQNKFRRLMIPYFTSSILIFYPLWYFLGRHFGENASRNDSPVQEFIGIFYANGFDEWMAFNVPLWFLPCLFCTLILAYFIYWCSKENVRYLVFYSLLFSAIGYAVHFYAFLPWSIDIAMTVQIFMLIGTLLRGIELKSRWWLLAVPILAVCAMWNGRVDMNGRVYGNLALYYLGGISGTILCMKLSVFLSEQKTPLFGVSIICFLILERTPLSSYYFTCGDIRLSPYFSFTFSIYLWKSRINNIGHFMSSVLLLFAV